MKLHMMTVHLKTKFKCQQCDYVNSNINMITRHDKDHHDSREVFRSTCGACEKHFNNLGELKKHIESVHCSHFENRRKKKKKEEYQKAEDKLFPCKNCPYSSDVLQNIKLHIERRHLCPKFNCKNCGFECKNVKDIFEHIKSDHDNDQSLIGSLCGGYCDKYFEDYQQYKDHSMVHYEYLNAENRKNKNTRKKKVKTGQKIDADLTHKCNQGDCDFVSSKACVRIHIMLKHMRTNFTCIRCTTTFRNVNLASRHVKREHNKDLSCLKSYCTACDFSSDDFIAFDRHTMNVHCQHLRPEGMMGGRRWKDFRDIRVSDTPVTPLDTSEL